MQSWTEQRKEDRDPVSGWRQPANPNVKGNQKRDQIAHEFEQDREQTPTPRTSRRRPLAKSQESTATDPAPPRCRTRTAEIWQGGRRRRGGISEQTYLLLAARIGGDRHGWLAGWRCSGERRGGGERPSGEACLEWGISGSQIWGFKGSLQRPQRSDCSSLLAICVRATHVRSAQPLKTRYGL
jgi:hypothetical protein